MFIFFTHLKELKIKLCYAFFCFVITFAASYFHIPQLVSTFSISFVNSIKDYNFDFIFINVFEVFNTYLILSLFTSSFLCFPVITYILFTFIKPGLFSYEKRFIQYIGMTMIRFLMISSLFCFFFLIPCFLSFLFELTIFGTLDFIVLKNNIRLYDYILFVCKSFFIYCYIVFQIPTFVSIVVFLRQPKPLFFFKFRRFCLIVSFFLGCIFSSSDLLSFFFISLFLFLNFEFLVFLSILKIKYSYFK